MYANERDTRYTDTDSLQSIAVQSPCGQEKSVELMDMAPPPPPPPPPDGHMARVLTSKDSGFIEIDGSTDGHSGYIKPDSVLREQGVVDHADAKTTDVPEHETGGRNQSKLADIYTTPRYRDEPLHMSDNTRGNQVGEKTLTEEQVSGGNYDRLKENHYEKITSFHRDAKTELKVKDTIPDEKPWRNEIYNTKANTNMDFMQVGSNSMESIPTSKAMTSLASLREDGSSTGNEGLSASLLGNTVRMQERVGIGCGTMFMVIVVTFVAGVLTGAAGPVSFIIIDRGRPCECMCSVVEAGVAEAGNFSAKTGTSFTPDIRTTTSNTDLSTTGMTTNSTTVVAQASTTVPETSPSTSKLTTVTSATSSTVPTTTPSTTHTTTPSSTTTPTTPSTTQEPTPTGGAVYTRWGRTVCPEDGTQAVYKGYAAGGDSSQVGGITRTVCLPEYPNWNLYSSTADDDRAFLYGTEYSSENSDYSSFLGKADLLHQDMPCVVCQARGKPAHIVVPGRMECYADWHLEYTGYLMAGKHNQNHGSEMVCVDKEPEVREGGATNTGGNRLYFVEVRTGTLPPNYVDRRELACAVCTQ